MKRNEEIFDIVDTEGKVIGTAARSEVHGNPSLIHRSIHILVFNSAGKLFLQKRADNKDIQPGKWDTSVGGHVDSGEDVLDAAKREAREELSIELDNLEFLYSYIWRTEVETELVTSYRALHDDPITTDPAEISIGSFWSFEDIEKNIGSGVFTPNFEHEFAQLKALDN